MTHIKGGGENIFKPCFIHLITINDYIQKKIFIFLLKIVVL